MGTTPSPLMLLPTSKWTRSNSASLPVVPRRDATASETYMVYMTSAVSFWMILWFKIGVHSFSGWDPSKHCCTGPVLVRYIRLYSAYMASLYWSSNILHPGSVVALYGLPAMDLYRIVLGQYRTCRQPWYGLYTLFLYWASTINWYWTSTGPF